MEDTGACPWRTTGGGHWCLSMIFMSMIFKQVSELKEQHADDKKRWESDLLLQTRRADRYAMTISEKERIIESFQVCVDKQELVIASYYELLMFAVEQAGGTYLEKEMPF
mgnify:CR=1 FL=1